MNDTQIHAGFHASYYWLTSTEHYSGTILTTCPEVVIGRYVAVTSVDGGVMRPAGMQLASGWEVRGGIGYSPKIEHAGDVPHQLDGFDAPGYDEFYVFEAPCGLRTNAGEHLFRTICSCSGTGGRPRFLRVIHFAQLQDSRATPTRSLLATTGENTTRVVSGGWN